MDEPANDKFLNFVGIGECFVDGAASFALVNLNLDGATSGVRFDLNSLSRLTGALVEIQAELQRRAGPNAAPHATPVTSVRSAKATAPVGVDAVAVQFLDDQGRPYVFGLTRQQAFQFAKDILSAHETAKRNATIKKN